MKTTLILLLTITITLLQPSLEAAVKILKISGDNASFSVNRGKTFKKLKLNSRIKEGSIIQAGANSQVDLQLEEKILLRVSEGSKMEIGCSKTTSNQDRDVRVYCLAGELVCASSPLTAKSKLEIRTSAGVGGARGAVPEFDAAFDGRIRCLNGTVVVVYVVNALVPAITLGPGDESALRSNLDVKWIEKLNDKNLAALSEKVSDLKKSNEDYKEQFQKSNLKNKH